jgi:glycosyltransferase involved in cell wall biosynthesis
MTEQFVRRPSRSKVRLLKLLKRSGDIGQQVDNDYLLKSYPTVFETSGDDEDTGVVQRYLDAVTTMAVDPNAFFSELGYLTHNADVASEVQVGRFHCGFHHWLEFGRAEARRGWVKQTAVVEGRSERPAEFYGAPYFLPLSDFKVEDPATLSVDEAVRILRHSGVVDIDRYLELYPDLQAHGVDPIWHYVTWGHKEKRSLHPFFDDSYYLDRFPESRNSAAIPLLHYLFIGARHGGNPHPLINTASYAAGYGLDLTQSNPLVHYTMSPDRDKLVSTPHFDEDFYIQHHPECVEFPGGAFLHFVSFGVYAGFKPNPNFNTRYYYATHLNNDYSVNAYYHYLTHGEAQGLAADVPAGVSTLARDVRYFANPGPQFEELNPDIARGRARRGKLISFYLPQFHAFPENDEWWGKGFTEWRNLPRGIPRFAGHYQPRIPRDLSFYDLTDKEVIRRQIEMATSMGIWAFAFYFYWFNRHRLMENPLDAFLADPSMNMPFMLIWANENWTRRWDGAESQVLIKQDHLPGDDEALVDCFQSYFADSRYIRLNGRPLLVIYRADIIPDTPETLTKWRRLFKERHNEEPLIYLAQTFGAEDPDVYGFDGAIEFPPHKIGRTVPEINRDLHFFDWDYEGSVRRYSDAISISLNEAAPGFPLVKTVFPSWDNNARRQTGGMVFHGATPKLFGDWLDGALNFARQNPVEGEELVFINAWNEWCEGAYLEPDIHFGGAMLNQLASTVTASQKRAERKAKVLLVGHDAFPAGAQRNMLAMAKTLQNRFGVEVQVVLLGGGDFLPRYQEAVPTTVCGWDGLAECLRQLAANGFRKAILNTVVTGPASMLLKELDFQVVSLIHELPQIIEEYKLQSHAEAVCRNADNVVFPSNFVRQAFVEKAGPIDKTVTVMPQGVYQRFERDRQAGLRIREELDIPVDAALVLNVGYGDLRKGVDIFCHVAHLSFDRRLDMHFVWAGDIHPSLKAWLVGDLSRKGITNLHFIGERNDVPDLMNAADVLFLTSREDPFPSVVIEAMQVGLPVVAFENNGGFVDLLSGDPRLGSLVPQADMGIIITELIRLSKEEGASDADVEHRISRARNEFDFNDYVFSLLQMFDPTLRRVTAVVPNYNYAGYLSARLATVFDQTYPIYEIIVLDDVSTDNSVEELDRIIARTGRDITFVLSEVNGGSAFKQWRKATDLARGELLWIAEADDLAEDNLVERLAQEFAENEGMLFAFSDSRSIDSDGYKVYDSYIPYADSIAPKTLAEDKVFTSRAFISEALATANLILNVSSVLWRREVLNAAFESAGKEALALRVAGDWRLYLAEGKVGYVADQLNIHRRHRISITSALSADAHLDEVKAVHTVVNKAIGRNKSARQKQKKYLEHVSAWLKRTH